jgi:UDP-N-acetylmuramate--alanine ligase
MMNAKTVHIIGLGGIGTSAIARYFLSKGAKVSGSDVVLSKIIEDLIKEGVDFRLGHFVENVPQECELVVYSRAVSATNPERQIVSELGITEFSYPQFLGELAKQYKTIAVSGTNGKSTTTAMIASILIEAGFDPTVIVGTQVPCWLGHNFRAGNSEWFVVEACEHMGSFLSISPDIAVVTNIAEDHLDYYNDLNHIKNTFAEWLGGIKKGGSCVINSQDKNSLLLSSECKDVFGFENREIVLGGQKFDVSGDKYQLSIPGEFNASNASAAITVARKIGISYEVCASAIANFKGTWRRFECLGSWLDAQVYSDYAHHPDAIKGTINAFIESFPNHRLVIVFEPHQRSRTKELFDEFVKSFDGASELILAQIYEVEGRNEGDEVSSLHLTDKIKERGTIGHVVFAKDYDEIESILRDRVKKDDIVVFMGAGTIDNLARKLV